MADINLNSSPRLVPVRVPQNKCSYLGNAKGSPPLVYDAYPIYSMSDLSGAFRLGITPLGEKFQKHFSKWLRCRTKEIGKSVKFALWDLFQIKTSEALLCIFSSNISFLLELDTKYRNIYCIYPETYMPSLSFSYFPSS